MYMNILAKEDMCNMFLFLFLYILSNRHNVLTWIDLFSCVSHLITMHVENMLVRSKYVIALVQ